MISKHITYEEATKSQTAIRKGIENVPSVAELTAMKLVAEKIFEPLRDHFDIPIGISSFYRSRALNKAIRGAPNSQHCKGEAMDIDADILGGITNSQIFEWIRKNLIFDQLIKEFGAKGWIHVSYRASGNRVQVLEFG